MEDFNYQLRRIGPPASCGKVPNVMRLQQGLTKIGRGQYNDYYLDSTQLKNFISRYHAEVEGKQNENGEIEFILNDKGLNGTFINDIRTSKTCVLEEGDKLTFGHTNGYKIKPGEQASQPLSEFQFIFEKVQKPTRTTEAYDDIDASDNSVGGEEVGERVSEPLSNSGDRTCLTANRSNLQTQARVKLKDKTNDSPRIWTDSRSQRDTDSVDECDGGESIQGNDLGESANNNKVCVSANKLNSVKLTSAVTNIDEDSSNFSETLPDLDGFDTSYGSFSREKKESKTITQRVASVSDGVTSDDSEGSGKVVSGVKGRPKGKQKHTELQTNNKVKKRKTQGSMNPRRKRKTARRPATSSGEEEEEEEDLEEGVEWYEEDTCSSVDCKRPKKKRTPWVQCDDCDSWYHTMCVGASYNQVKDSNIKFSCGCN